MSTVDTQLLTVVARAQRELRIPSLTAAVLARGTVAAVAAVGSVDGRRGGEPVGPDTQYRIGSISKTFTAALVMRLRDDGLLSVDDPLERHVPGTPIGAVTLGQLLSHTSGLRAETDAPWWERTAGLPFAELVPQLQQVVPAGSRLHYSNLGFAVLAEVVARHRGVGWDESVRTELLEPLGLTRTTPRPSGTHAQGVARHPHADLLLAEPEHHHGAMAAAGQLWSTVGDLAVWGEFLRSGHPGVLAPETLAEMRRPRGVHDLPGAAWLGAHGLGLELGNVDGRRRVGHGGSMPGFLAVLRVDVESGRGLAVMANTTSGLSPALVAQLWEVVEQQPAERVEPWYAEGDAGLLDVTGTWYWGPAPYRLDALPDGGLDLAPAGLGRAARFVPAGPDRWIGTSGYFDGEELVVVRDAGRPAHLDLASFRFTRTPYDPSADVPGGVDGWR
ncbi:serine hydrolase domain-containing protein [Auraticoccus monumenti]|uniref:CubicO group peptidase, beta-lactamase class C family n=1 Tax=Auraticoccus monumenti TaxID=675864 RepID=A0A1G6US86_9ACTN|nr:serine hydrolase domain-containing protein [Auraticoccus monumenti]SDD44182.1 CubicO group peptidase, beta-lactamase class C family [Auraticoccus monumenti]